ncbi:hypothetical protein GCM10023194_10540 [Planotetraspora phitsanulokensis]|uniref:Uncharacterized protein n=1 Tax=Planotetraspora phitsanulokensis TaxID=575192 RepID=A0A8J3UC59_9ACTN|nr:hypothetical protein [Planotetraspora phitsanulokensis]GII40621.1 hypothetical protein Pph01_56240 [Planotetraspora phitsanulokensis]
MSSSHDRPGADDRFDELEAELRALGETLHVSTPSPDATARAVRARLEAPRPKGALSRRPGLLPRLRLSPRKAVAAVMVFLAVLIGATPQGRAAVVSILRFAGVEIRVGEPGPLPTGVPSPLPSERRVTLDEARRAVAFPIAVPSALGDPADVRVADGGRVVTLLWPGLRLDEYDGTLNVVFRKDLGEPWPEDVPTIRGWWIQQPHEVSYVPKNGGPPSEDRVAGPTLIWQLGGVGLRLEGANREEAVRIANSTR